MYIAVKGEKYIFGMHVWIKKISTFNKSDFRYITTLLRNIKVSENLWTLHIRLVIILVQKKTMSIKVSME